MELADLAVTCAEKPLSDPGRILCEEMFLQKKEELRALGKANGTTFALEDKLDLSIEIVRARRAHLSALELAKKRIDSLEANVEKVELLTNANAERVEIVKADIAAIPRLIKTVLAKSEGTVMNWQDWLNRQFMKTLIWAVFVVGFALLDVIVSSIYAAFAPEASGKLAELYEKGALFLVVAAISADAIGRLISLMYKRIFPPPKSPRAKIYTAHFTMLILAGVLAGTAALCYMVIVTSKYTIQTSSVLLWSKRFMIANLLIGASTVLMVED